MKNPTEIISFKVISFSTYFHSKNSTPGDTKKTSDGCAETSKMSFTLVVTNWATIYQICPLEMPHLIHFTILSLICPVICELMDSLLDDVSGTEVKDRLKKAPLLKYVLRVILRRVIKNKQLVWVNKERMVFATLIILYLISILGNNLYSILFTNL